MLFGASDQGDGWGPAEPGSFDINAVRSQNMMAGREQPDRVRRLGTRREPHGGVSGKIQHVEDPATGNLFSGDRRRSMLGKRRMLNGNIFTSSDSGSTLTANEAMEGGSLGLLPGGAKLKVNSAYQG